VLAYATGQNSELHTQIHSSYHPRGRLFSRSLRNHASSTQIRPHWFAVHILLCVFYQLDCTVVFCMSVVISRTRAWSRRAGRWWI